MEGGTHASPKEANTQALPPTPAATLNHPLDPPTCMPKPPLPQRTQKGLEVGLALPGCHPKGNGYPHIPRGESRFLKAVKGGRGKVRKASERAELGRGGEHQEGQKPCWGKVSPARTLSSTLESAQQEVGVNQDRSRTSTTHAESCRDPQ